jgi:deoxyribonuclease V
VELSGLPVEPSGERWPTDPQGIAEVQHELAGRVAEPWEPALSGLRIGGVWVCFPRGVSGSGSAGDSAWAAAVVMTGRRVLDSFVLTGVAGAPYVAGKLALRVGTLLQECVGGLMSLPDVLLLDATARDHPRRAGLALHLGAVLGLPTIGVTHRPLIAEGSWPPDTRGATTPLYLDNVVVGCWLRTRPGVRPVAVHPGWRVRPAAAIEVILTATDRRHRTPEPLRHARQRARRLRSATARVG